jgi:predicted PurR-regulated permease PerM
VDPQFAEFAVLLAVIAAFSELIPNYGPWIASIPAVLISLTISPEAVVATIVLYLILMFTEGQVLVPKIEGGAFSFHPALVLFLVVAGVALMGILGAILALPVTAAAWRSVRFAFRRATGLSRDAALAWPDDPDLDTIVEPLPAADVPPPVRTADEGTFAVEPGASG